MARTKDSNNKHSAAILEYILLSSEDQIILLANSVIERVIQDRASAAMLFQKIERLYATQ